MAEEVCRFCEIAGGRLDAYVVYGDADSLAFLDTRPLFHGHALLVPRAHHETLSDLPPDLVAPFFTAVRTLAEAVRRAMDAEGSFVAINNGVSQSVPHLHAHVVPRRRGDGLRGFFWPRTRYADEDEAIAAQTAIRKALDEGRADP